MNQENSAYLEWQIQSYDCKETLIWLLHIIEKNYPVWLYEFKIELPEFLFIAN